MDAPSTPSKNHNIKLELDQLYSRLSSYWDLRVQSSTDSPSTRAAKREGSTPEQSARNECIFKLRFLYFKNKQGVLAALDRFDKQADNLYKEWVIKPGADRDLLPKPTRKIPRPLTASERVKLFQLLLELINPLYEECKTPGGARANWSFSMNARQASFETAPVLPSIERPLRQPQFGASPGIPSTGNRGKRPLEEFPSIETTPKKAKTPPEASRSREMLSAVQPNQRLDANTSAHTSFTTNMSGVFSQANVDNSGIFQTQETQPDDEVDFEAELDKQILAEILSQVERGPQSSEYWGSSFDVDPVMADTLDGSTSMVDESLSQELLSCALQESESDVENSLLLERLQNVFPELPTCLKGAPLRISYEIIRIFLFTGTPINEMRVVVKREWDDYETLWRFLRNHPLLAGKQFPEKCGQDVWSAAAKDFSSGFRGVKFSAKLVYSPTNTGPLFVFKLQPMVLEYSHRLGRKLGNDRFFEIEVPNIEGYKVPKFLKRLDGGGRTTIINWLVDVSHKMLGRIWESFFVKDSETKKVKIKKQNKKKSPADEVDSSPTFRVYFFAVDGYGFRMRGSRATENLHVKITRAELLNTIRPTRKNGYQTFLKLFARTALAVSRNSATITLESSQIKLKDDIKSPESGEVMTDGAGRISLPLAMKVSEKLGLPYIPTAFQGRFGEAKGLWVVDRGAKDLEDWIELYKSQRKWERSTRPNGESDDPSHRTLEILKFSAPLRSADLNTQLLPILMHQAKSPNAMKNSITSLLKEGLKQEVEELERAMGTAQTFRGWVKATNSSTADRIKSGKVLFGGGFPIKLEEKLNLLLDAGFIPQELLFLKELARTAFTNKCDEIKARFNITVGKSTYAYMIPDFWDVLEENEVYLDLSSFKDSLTGFEGTYLNGSDILVARNPAHYASDIQKVKAVSKVELHGLKDVIVFSTKGEVSLASKLSGGDYDGDLAWVCWQADIVDNFANAGVPKMPDLVKQGFITKNSMTYDDLVQGSSDPTGLFLRKSFDFNLHQSLLGQCTKFKEKLLYNHKDLESRELVFMSTLLSSLVDLTKQGYIFTDKHFSKVKNYLNVGYLKEPLYEEDIVDPTSADILDHLAAVAHDTIEACKTNFENVIPNGSQYDDDLVKRYKWAEAQEDEQWKSLLAGLKEDLENLKADWKGKWAKDRGLEETKPNFAPIRDEFYERYQNILPCEDTMLSRCLLPSYVSPENSEWALLKASALFASYKKGHSVGKFVWHMAGIDLARLKAEQRGGIVPVVPQMYAMLKPDAKFVRQLGTDQHSPSFWDISDGGGGSEELEAFEDDD